MCYAQRWEGNNAIENYENYIYKFYCKGNVLTEPCGSAECSLYTTGVIPLFPLKPSAYSCPCHLHFHYHWLYFKATKAFILHHNYMYFRVITFCTVE